MDITEEAQDLMLASALDLLFLGCGLRKSVLGAIEKAIEEGFFDNVDFKIDRSIYGYIDDEHTLDAIYSNIEEKLSHGLGFLDVVRKFSLEIPPSFYPLRRWLVD